MPDSRRQPWWIALVLIGVAVAGFAGAWWLKARQTAAGPQTVAVLRAPVDCDAAHESCAAQAGELSVRLALGPALVALEPFPVVLELTGGQPETVTVDLAMADMDMGINRVTLAPAPAGRWLGQAVLPVCWTGRRDWQARVWLDRAGERREAVFSFVTQ